MLGRLSGVQSEVDPQNLQHPVLAFLKRYWDLKRGPRIMPSRADIRPSEMKEHLGWIVMLDALPDFSDFRYRTIGTRVTQYFLSDSTGKTITEAFQSYGPAAVDCFLWTHRQAAQARVGVRVFGDASWLGRSFLDFDALVLPLSDDGNVANKILSAFIFDVSAQLQVRPAPPSDKKV
ncbi:MAG TPA: PAS domain-containing protein [Rhizomicrobium sp.]|nr:PAS domain-containing protein [Rhizomicrobium sp.]